MALVSPEEFLWREWRLGEGRFKGRGPTSSPRPTAFPKVIPPTWWARLAAFLLKRKLADPYWAQRAFWRVPAFAVAWTGQDPDDVCRSIAANGGKAVWVQNDPKQRTRAGAWRRAATTHGLKLVAWEWATDVTSAQGAINAFQADGFAANVEHDPGMWDAYCDQLRRMFPNLPLAVWTNFWGAGAAQDDQGRSVYLREHSAPFIRNGFVCVTEAYMVNEQGPQPTLSPDHLDWTAKAQLGYPETIPSFGIYRTGPATYEPFKARYPGYVWYLFENYPASGG